MRVNPDSNSALLAALQRVGENQQQILKQLASGWRVKTPSDDPAAAAGLVDIQSQDSETQQCVTNAKSAQMQMQAADSALNSVGTILQRAMTLAIEGANGTLSDSDRDAVATELIGIKSQLLELANSSIQGIYLFAGTAVSAQPYVSDSNAPTGITYKGNSMANQLEVGQGYWIGANVPGSSIFGDGYDGAFQALSNLISAIQNNAGVDDANAAVQTAIDQVSVARVQYGNIMNQLTSSQNIMNDRHVQLQQQVNSLAAVDMSQAASNLVSAETSRNALLEVISRSSRQSLFDYLGN